MQPCGERRPLGGAEVGEDKRLPVGPLDMQRCGGRRALRGADVGEGEWLPVE